MENFYIVEMKMARAVFKYLRNCHLQENLDLFTVDM